MRMMSKNKLCCLLHNADARTVEAVTLVQEPLPVPTTQSIPP